MENSVLEFLVNAERLHNALLNDDDFRILLENEENINAWADYEVKMREVVSKKNMNDFDEVIKYLQDEHKYLSDKKSAKADIVKSHIKQLKKIHDNFVYAFMHWKREIDRYRTDEMIDEMADRISELDNLIVSEKRKNIIAAAQKYDIKEGLSLLKLDDVDPFTFKFIKTHESSFNKITPGSIKETDGYLKKYKEKHGEYPNNVKQLKEFIK